MPAFFIINTLSKYCILKIFVQTKHSLLRLKAFEMDLKVGKSCEDERENDQVYFHDPRKDICIILNKRRSNNSGEDLDSNDLACYS